MVAGSPIRPSCSLRQVPQCSVATKFSGKLRNFGTPSSRVRAEAVAARRLAQRFVFGGQVSRSVRGLLRSGSDQCCGKDRTVSSRQLRRLTIAPRRGEGRALRFVPSEVPCGPRSPPNSMSHSFFVFSGVWLSPFHISRGLALYRPVERAALQSYFAQHE